MYTEERISSNSIGYHQHCRRRVATLQGVGLQVNAESHPPTPQHSTMTCLDRSIERERSTVDSDIPNTPEERDVGGSHL